MEQDFWGKKCIVSPSLITLDMCNLEHEATLVKESGLESLHVDILDGHFSPSMHRFSLLHRRDMRLFSRYLSLHLNPRLNSL